MIPSKANSTTRKSKGFVLVIVLWIVIILIIIVSTLAQSSRLSTRISQSHAQKTACRWVGRAGIETAIHVLMEDDTDYDAFEDDWYYYPDQFENIQIGSCTFTVDITDESAKLNINTATKKHLENLLQTTTEQAGSIIDWRDKDSEISDEGAEAEYYNTLEYYHPIRNDSLKTINELLFVKSITNDDFYADDLNLDGQIDSSEQLIHSDSGAIDQASELRKGIGAFLTCTSFCRNLDATGSTRVNITKTKSGALSQQLNISTSYAKWIEEKANGKDIKSIADLIDKSTPKENNTSSKQGKDAKQIDLETFKSIADQITITDDEILTGLVNINTAPQEVLTALLEGDENLANEIVTYRDGLEVPMDSITDLLDVDTMTVTKFKKIAPFITPRSDVFAISSRATAKPTGLKYTTKAIVSRDSKTCNILYWYEGIGE